MAARGAASSVAGLSADRGRVPHGQIAGIQRSRLLAAAVRTVDELGYSRATVAHITRRARVSRRTFYELFANRDECLAAVLEDVVANVRAEIECACLEGLPWREQMRGGLLAILAFFDREPVLARVCVVESLHAGYGVHQRREEILSALTAVVDGGRGEGARGQGCPPLTAEGLVGAVLAILYARLHGKSEPLTALLGELMGMIVLPYLGPAAARREQIRPAPATAGAPALGRRGAGGHGDPLEEIPMRLTYRTARALEAIAEQPGVSNRGVAERAGVIDQGQISKLLARFERLGLAVNSGHGHAKGEPNAWTLTQTGRQVVQSIHGHTHSQREAA
jgi:AcrR family transcriptional regulator/DNA-binding MarR family transcriptional regulator